MAKLIYSAITSLDGYVADERGGIGWAAPDGEVHAFVNELERPLGTYLYGRRMYEAMAYWETRGTGPATARQAATSPGSGGRRRRSSTPARSPTCRQREPAWSGSSIRTRSGG